MRPNGSSRLWLASKSLPLAVEGFALARQEGDRSEAQSRIARRELSDLSEEASGTPTSSAVY